MLLNWINSTGEFVLADLVTRDADAQVAASAGAITKGAVITAFTAISVLGDARRSPDSAAAGRTRLPLGRCAGALVVLPIVAALGYGLIVFVPIFSIIRLVKIGENSVNYSLMNTTRHALFLPVDRDAKYEGKTAIDTFFWRVGDLIQAGGICGPALARLDGGKFRAAQLGARAGGSAWRSPSAASSALAQKNSFNVPPEVGQPIPDLMYAPGQPFRHFVPEDAFRDADPGDVLNLSARLAGGQPLPRWVQFDAGRRAFLGTCPTATARKSRSRSWRATWMARRPRVSS